MFRLPLRKNTSSRHGKLFFISKALETFRDQKYDKRIYIMNPQQVRQLDVTGRTGFFLFMR